MILSCGLSDTGCVREGNEDRILVDDRLSLFAIADGMGGHSYGEVAAEMALNSIHQYIEWSQDRPDVTWPFGYNLNLSLDENRLLTAIQLANRRVWQRSGEADEYEGMGTTVAAVLVLGNKASIASVGDSRVYLFRGGDLNVLTADDTWVSAMVRQGALDPRDAPRHPMRNVLTQAAGAREEIDVHVLEAPLIEGDIVLISSDGLHGVVDEAQIRSILVAANSAKDLRESATGLIEAARTQGAPDNVSCILLRYTTEADSAETPAKAA